jgi:hypothetical protein
MKGRNFSATSSALPCTTRPVFGESFFWRLANSISRGKTILLHILLAVASSPQNSGKDDEGAFNDFSGGSARYHVRNSGVGWSGWYRTNFLQKPTGRTTRQNHRAGSG